MSRSGRRAIVEAKDVPLIDTFQFANAFLVPSTVSFRVEWEATGPPEQLGSGNMVPATDRAAFLGTFAPAAPPASFPVPNSGSASHRRDAPTLISATRRSERNVTEPSSHSAPERRPR
jgi:hypothetical protein